MPQLPDGDLAPLDGALPPAALDAFEPGDSPFGVYLHVPFCRVRCGYCDFNTYTLGELDQDGAQATGDYLRAVRAELELAARVLGTSRRVDTVFMGGGTPTMLSPQMLGELLGWVEELWGLAPIRSTSRPCRRWLQLVSLGCPSGCKAPSRMCWKCWSAPMIRHGCPR